MEKFVDILCEIIGKIGFKIRLICMDAWYYLNGSCFGLFPPSFYYTHTEEEIRSITDKTLKELRTMIEELDD